MMRDEQRLLEVLAGGASGASEGLSLPRGFSREVIFDQLHAGCVTSTPERTFAAGRPVHRTRVQITEAGRRALTERRG